MSEKSPPSPNKYSKFWACICISIILKVILFPLFLHGGLLIWKATTKPKLTPIISTLDGPLQGNIRYSRDGQEYWEFLGIPFAKPPVGDLLFKPPVSTEPWEDVKQVTSYPPDCAQFEPILNSKPTGDLDCLYLNVFVNVGHGNHSKPVMVYIYGGAFISGGTQWYHPEFYMDQDIVLVVLNYRVGPYGFLNLQEFKHIYGENVPHGNMGLLDQNLALKWVQQNIAMFGGDPQRVTLFGQSAGAASSHLHLFTSMSHGLFQRLILQSGTSLSPWVMSGKPGDIAVKFGKNLGCKIGDTGEGVLECYKNMRWEEVVKNQYTIYDPLYEKQIFLPTVDGKFLNELPQETLKSGNFPAIPIMIGMNSGECALRTSRFVAVPEDIPKLNTDWPSRLSSMIVLDPPLPLNASMEIRNKYFGNETFAEDSEDFRRNITLMCSDACFHHTCHRTAMFHAKIGAPVHMYVFNYTSNIFMGIYSGMRVPRPDDWLPVEFKLFWGVALTFIKEKIFGGNTGSRELGNCHGDDIPQDWNVFGLTKYLTGSDSDFSRKFVKAMVDFANDTEPLKFGDVNWPTINNHLDSGKDQYTMPYMILDNENKSRVIAEPFGKRLNFWANLRDWYI